jgi:drug/metabolite transporter (DMT)-like permease
MNTSTSERSPAPRGMVLAAFAAIYLIWGSTYLGIETLPPLLMGGGRFLTAGLLLYTWLRATGTPAPSLANWRHAVLASALLLLVGNGGVNWAEQRVSSGLAALIIAGTPLWFALFDWLRPGGIRPSLRTILGIAVGFAGVLMLVGSRSGSHGGARDFTGIAVLVCASAAWATGSLYTKYAPKLESPMMVAAQQMIAGGMLLICGGLAMGEGSLLEAARISTRSLLAFVYLTLIGSLVGFSTYAWLLKATTPARLSTYAYVNPVIAVFLGWALGGETLTRQMLTAAAVIVLGVVIITARRKPREEQVGSSAPRPTGASTGSTLR